jgi:hypothetical protein
MTDNISINIPKDGAIPYVEGSHAVGVQVETRTTESDALQVRLTFEAVGEDALHAGSLVAEFTLIRPEQVPHSDKSDDEQATIGSNYARLMVEAAQHIVGEHLSEFYSEALSTAIADRVAEQGGATVEGIAKTCMMIAALLIVQAGGDKAKAKANADVAGNPTLRDLALKSGMTEALMGHVTETVREAIDLCDLS